MIRRPPRSTQSRSSAASDVYKRQADLIRLYGLNESLPVQFGKWFSKFWTFPFDNTAWGYSFTDGLPVRDKIFARIPSTLWLTGMSLLVTVIVAIPIGILQAVRQYS